MLIAKIVIILLAISSITISDTPKVSLSDILSVLIVIWAITFAIS